MQMVLFYIFIAAAYLIGSYSSAIVVCKLMKLADPRQSGSGNPGATNVLRIAGKGAAILVLVTDALKGFLPVILAKLVGLDGLSVALIALAAVLGHVFPIFFKFQGGKGVATTFGALLALNTLVAIGFAIVWVSFLAIKRYVSLASIAAVGLMPFLNQFLGNSSYFYGLALIAILVIWRHRSNIQRLLENRENKFTL